MQKYIIIQLFLLEIKLQLALNKVVLSVGQIKRTVAAFRILQQCLTTVKDEQEIILKKIAEDAKAIAIERGNHTTYLSDLDRILNHSPMNSFSLKSGIPLTIINGSSGEPKACTFIPKFKLVASAIARDYIHGVVDLVDVLSQKVVKVINSGYRKVSQMLWIEQKNYLIICYDNGSAQVLLLWNGGTKLKVIATLRGHQLRINSLKYIEQENLLLTTGSDPYILVWSMTSFRRCGIIYVPNKVHYGLEFIIYIPHAKLIGFGQDSRSIQFYHLRNRTFAFDLQCPSGYFHKINNVLYLPKNKLLVASVGDRDVKIWKCDEQQKKFKDYRVIQTLEKNIVSIVVNEDESQLLFLTPSKFVEMYSFKNDQTAKCAINSKDYNVSVFLLDSLNKAVLFNKITRTGVVLNF